MSSCATTSLIQQRRASTREKRRKMMINDWPELTKLLSADLRELRAGAPEVMKAFSATALAATAAKALDAKTKELIALAISVAVRCDDCIAFHAKAAVDRGASREEVLETLGMTVYMGAGPSVMYASHALQAFTQFEEAKVTTKVS
jgi:AhpD family alkylhydroperoxidase